jgi:hypothetical protein
MEPLRSNRNTMERANTVHSSGPAAVGGTQGTQSAQQHERGETRCSPLDLGVGEGRQRRGRGCASKLPWYVSNSKHGALGRQAQLSATDEGTAHRIERLQHSALHHGSRVGVLPPTLA